MSTVQAWRLLRERPGPSGFLSVRTRTYAMPDNRPVDWDILVGGRTVAILALTEDRHVVLARQFRPGPGRVMSELPGGLVEDHEDVVTAAARELREETGFVADRLVPAGQTWLAGYATHIRHAVLAEGCRPVVGQSLGEDEYCEPVLVPLEGFLAHLRGGQLTDADMAWMCLDRLRPWSPGHDTGPTGGSDRSRPR